MTSLRLLHTGRHDAFYNMGLDEAILESAKRNYTCATLRFYEFSPPSITIGFLQSTNDIDLELCEQEGIDVTKRITGGRAVFHDGDLTYSLVTHVQDPLLGGSVLDTYKAISKIFADALSSMGVQATVLKAISSKDRGSLCFGSTSRYELTVCGKKVFGSAQRREGDFLLGQGSLLLVPPKFNVSKIFFSNIEEPSSIYSLCGKRICIQEFISTIENGLEKIGIKINRGKVSPFEEEKAQEYSRKYMSTKWLNYLTRENSCGIIEQRLVSEIRRC